MGASLGYLVLVPLCLIQFSGALHIRGRELTSLPEATWLQSSRIHFTPSGRVEPCFDRSLRCGDGGPRFGPERADVAQSAHAVGANDFPGLRTLASGSTVVATCASELRACALSGHIHLANLDGCLPGKILQSKRAADASHGPGSLSLRPPSPVFGGDHRESSSRVDSRERFRVDAGFSMVGDPAATNPR
jgi:hypothetical protein